MVVTNSWNTLYKTKYFEMMPLWPSYDKTTFEEETANWTVGYSVVDRLPSKSLKVSGSHFAIAVQRYLHETYEYMSNKKVDRRCSKVLLSELFIFPTCHRYIFSVRRVRTKEYIQTWQSIDKNNPRDRSNFSVSLTKRFTKHIIFRTNIVD